MGGKVEVPNLAKLARKGMDKLEENLNYLGSLPTDMKEQAEKLSGATSEAIDVAEEELLGSLESTDEETADLSGEPPQTSEDELAMRRVRRRLRDRFGRRATRGGGAEMAGTGYKLGG